LPMELSLAVTNSLNALRDRMIYCKWGLHVVVVG
jgi:hypothetical protein